MTLQTSSNYVALSNNDLLLEMEYNSFIQETRNLYFLKVQNKYNRSVNFINYNNTYIRRPNQITGNSFERSATQISEANWLKFDFNNTISYYEKYYPELTFFNINPTDHLKSDIPVIYHTLKIHVLQGYNFEDLDGIILRLSYRDQNGNVVFVGNLSYNKDFDLEYHTKIFRIGDRSFDRFLKIAIPDIKSLASVNAQIQEVDKLKDKEYRMANYPDITSSRLMVEYFEISKEETNQFGFKILSNTTLINENLENTKVELETEDLFSGIAAVIRESQNGDFFELFPTFRGNLLEDYFAERNQQYSNDFIIYHDVELSELTNDLNLEENSFNIVSTDRFTRTQDSNFNEIYRYRPVILNANTQAFSIDYTLRIHDKLQNFYIIRKSTYTNPDAAKYGRYLTKLPIDLKNPVKIVNKYVKEEFQEPLGLESNPYILSNDGSFYSGTINQISYPIQINKLAVSGKTFLMKNVLGKTNTSEYEVLENVNDKFTVYTNSLVFGPGDCILYLGNFDNFVKFQFYNQIGKSVFPLETINSADHVFYLVFFKSDGSEIRITQNKEEILGFTENIESHEVLFKILAAQTKDIQSITDKKYHIVLEHYTSGVKDYETDIYTGTFDRLENFSLSKDTSLTKLLNI